MVFDNQNPPGEPFGFYDLYPGQVISDITWTASRGFGAGRSYRLLARFQPNPDGTLKAGGFEAVLEFSIFPRSEPAPTADAWGGPDVADEASGSTLTLDAAGSSAVGGGALDYEWTGPLVDSLSGEGIDWTQPTVEIPAGDDLGPLAVTLTVTDENDRSASDTTTVRVDVAPAGDASLVVHSVPGLIYDPSPIDEGTTVTMEITCEDPGDDTHTVEIRWLDDFAAEEIQCHRTAASPSRSPSTSSTTVRSPTTARSRYPCVSPTTTAERASRTGSWTSTTSTPRSSSAKPRVALPAGDAVLRRPGDSTDLSVLVTIWVRRTSSSTGTSRPPPPRTRRVPNRPTHLRPDRPLRDAVGHTDDRSIRTRRHDGRGDLKE